MAVSSGPAGVNEPVRFSFDEFVRFTEMHPEGEFELLDGVIYEVAPEGKEHLLTRLKLDTYLHQIVDLTRYTVGTEASFPAPGWNEGPKPDNVVSAGAIDPNDDNPDRPTAGDMQLVIEITNARSAQNDRELQRKLRSYARVSISDYWLIDLVSVMVVVHRDPTGEATEPTFRSIKGYGKGETIVALAVDGLSVGCDFLLKLAQKH